MVRLKIAYWEFDFEAVCPTLDHDLLSQAQIQMMVSLGTSLALEGFFSYLFTCGWCSLVSGSQNDIVVS